MRHLRLPTGLVVLVLAACARSTTTSPPSEAAAPRPADTAASQPTYWYITYHRVPFGQIDTLVRFWKEYQVPVWEEQKRAGTILDYLVLQHHTGNDETVVVLTRYPSWEAINDTSEAAIVRRLDPDSSRRAAAGETFRRLPPIPHRDGIYLERVSTAAEITPAAAGKETYWVMAHYKVDWNNVDSLVALERTYGVPLNRELQRAGQRSDWRMLQHAYAGTENVIYLIKAPSWAAINADSLQDAAVRRLEPDSTKRKTVQDAYTKQFTTGEHRDAIYTQVLP